MIGIDVGFWTSEAFAGNPTCPSGLKCISPTAFMLQKSAGSSGGGNTFRLRDPEKKVASFLRTSDTGT
eukprot:CAMPEP_0202967696 /NCGR_PEP_ID=MMETSP1396-20130829/12698_1 /ASSEMBLY_ACC=CAM_ASM_000872 /TAXON_ID= /ORGANISM="Pseudokeronopsis sp., Strain Brazil" /LENGTH=67 /DNA_ID=CAMNT_0049693095 /DNA_START=126 /DNA_END=329 /DNA_ORIENTATION=-